MCFNYYCQPVQARVMLHLKVLWEILQSESKLLCEHNDIKEVKKSQQKREADNENYGHRFSYN